MAFDLRAEVGKCAVEPVGGGFSTGTGVAEDEGGAVGGDEAREFLDEAFAGVTAGRIGIAAERRIDAEIDLFGGADVEDFAFASRANEELGDFLRGGDGGGDAGLARDDPEVRGADLRVPGPEWADEAGRRFAGVGGEELIHR